MGFLVLKSFMGLMIRLVVVVVVVVVLVVLWCVADPEAEACA